MTENISKKIKNKILIEFVFKQKNSLLVGKQSWPVQGIPFKVGLKVMNIGDQPFSGGTVEKIKITSMIAKLLLGFREIMQIPTINPRETFTIWLDTATVDFSGPAWMTCEIKSTNAEVTAFQRDPSGSIEECAENNNKWGDTIYLQPKMELLQTRTNILIAILTILTFLDSVIGLKAIMVFILNQISIVFQFLANLLQNIIR